ncbi:type II secretion system protein GspM [Pseudomonas fluorescens]|uniref:type II secretion system protein GspM n=1 Tax=Pseudomonas fluorescens TaxID=294 RepID=UPI003F9D0E40
MTLFTTLLQRWQRLSRREQYLLGGLAAFVLSVAAFSLIWLPTQQRLASAERHYQQQLALAAQLQQARPRSQQQSPAEQPLALRISESVLTTGLELQQMDTDNDLLRLTLSGEAMTLLAWLDQIEQQGAVLQALTLDKRDGLLEARVVLR